VFFAKIRGKYKRKFIVVTGSRAGLFSLTII
jgi:hypothetical protein